MWAMEVGFSSYWISAIPILILVLLVVLAVAFTRRSLPDGTSLLTPRRLVEGYIFSVVVVSMLLTSSGFGDILKAGLAHRYGLPFAYEQQPVWEEDHKAGEKPKYEYDSQAPKRDLLSGSAQLSVGILVGTLHLLGLRRLARTESLASSPVYKVFLITGLVIYTCAVLIYAVGSVQDLLVYRYGSAPPGPAWFNRPVPGEKIAGLLGFLPIWGVLVALLFGYARPGLRVRQREGP